VGYSEKWVGEHVEDGDGRWVAPLWAGLFVS
jgi:hypothetical protein